MRGVRARLAWLAAAVAASVAIGGCTTQPPPSPVASIPKLIVDFEDNVTSIYVTSVNADVRYGNITVVVLNDNLTSNMTFHEAKSYALVAHTNLTFFTINASADETSRFYYYNATLHIAPRVPADPAALPSYQIYIRETANGPIQTDAIPYRHVLSEGAR